MINYYTVIDIVNNKFVGMVFNQNNNEKVYQTQEYDIQSRAINDVNAYLQGKNSIPPTPSNTYVNTIQQAVPTTMPRTGRCCGR